MGQRQRLSLLPAKSWPPLAMGSLRATFRLDTVVFLGVQVWIRYAPTAHSGNAGRAIGFAVIAVVGDLEVSLFVIASKPYVIHVPPAVISRMFPRRQVTLQLPSLFFLVPIAFAPYGLARVISQIGR